MTDQPQGAESQPRPAVDHGFVTREDLEKLSLYEHDMRAAQDLIRTQRSELEQWKAQHANVSAALNARLDLLETRRAELEQCRQQLAERASVIDMAIEDNDALTVQLAAAQEVVTPAVRYWRSYFDPKLDKCPRPFDSSAHMDHDCVVSLRGRMHIAIGDYVRRLDAAQQEPATSAEGSE